MEVVQEAGQPVYPKKGYVREPPWGFEPIHRVMMGPPPRTPAFLGAQQHKSMWDVKCMTQYMSSPS